MQERRYMDDLNFDESFEVFGLEPKRLIKRNVPIYQTKEGENAIVIIPPLYEEWIAEKKHINKKFGIAIYYHRGVTPDNGMFVCLRLMKGERCPFCEKWMQLKDRQEKKIYAPKVRGAIWVVDVSSKEAQAEGVRLWLFGWAVRTFVDIQLCLRDPETKQVHNILRDPRVIFFVGRQEGEGSFRNIVVSSPRLGTNPVDPNKFEMWKEQVRYFSEIIDFPTQDELEPFFRMLEQKEEEQQGLDVSESESDRVYVDDISNDDDIPL